MKKITFLFFLSFLCLIGTTNAQEAQSNRFSSLAEAVESGSPMTISPQATTTSRPVIINATGTRASLPYLDRVSFQAACGSTLPLEDFAGGPVGIGSCGNIISSMGDTCYPPGEILPGVEITSNNPANTPQAVSVSAGTFGNSDPTVGSNFFIDFTVLNFPNMDVTSVGFDLYTFTSLESVDVRVFGTSGLIDTYTVAVSNPTFLGIIADETITSIEIEDLSFVTVEHIAQLEFGTCVLPSFTECGVPLGQPIPASGTAGAMTPSIVSVPDCGIVGANYNIDSVDLDLNHTFDGDLTITLTSPSGTALTLANGIGGAGDNYTNTVFMDGNPSIVTGTPPYTGTFQPEGGTFAAVFGSENIQGAWTLNIQDNLSGDSGVLNNFCFNYSQIAPNQPPVITCPTNISVDNSPGECGAFVSFTPATATDPEEGSIPTIQTAGLPSGSLFPLGINTVEYSATDSCGETVTCTFTITVNDTENPAITCPANITANNDTGVCGAAVNYTVTTSDNCPGETLVQTAGQASGTVFPVGTTTNTFIVTDASGNTATCSFDITVNDTELPVITCPANIAVNNDPGVCGAVANYTVTSSDNCPGETIVQTAGQASGTVFPVGTTTNTFIVTDASGNTATCSFDVTVTDNEPPIAICAVGGGGNISEAGTGAGQPIPASGTSGSMTPSVATVAETGVIGVDYDIDFVDLNLNHTFDGDLEITLTSPVGTTLMLSDNNGAAGDNYTGTVFQDGGANINAGVAPFTGVFEPQGGTFAAAFGGESVTGPWTLDIVDLFGGDSGTFFGFSINFIPLAGGGPIDVFLDASGNATITVADINDGSTDNCGIASMSISPSTFTCADVGINVVTLTVTDVNGNVSTCTSDVNVIDNIPPVAICQDITVQLDGSGNASIVGADVNNNSTDACGIASMTVSPDTFDCADVGTPVVVTLTVTDVNGNSSTCTSTVTVEDSVDPTWVIPPSNMTVECDGTPDPNGDFAAWLVSFSGTDNCGTAIVTNDSTGLSDDCGATGFETVTFTLDDGNGNSITMDATFTIEDTTAPTIVCPMDVNITADPGVCGAEVAFSDAVALDSCGSVTIAQTAGLPTNSFFPVGVSTVEFTATDECGNDTVCSFTITITDDEPAMAVCQDITIQLDEFGDASIIADDIDGGSTDNCGVASISASQTDFTCADVGDNDITLTVTDVNGNTSTCIAVVTVEDITMPIAVCQDITVPLDANGTVTITGMDIGSASTDACGIVSYDIDIDTFDCSNIGDNLVTLIITDPSGNTATCTAIVTIEDVTAPVLVCADVTLELGPDGTLDINPEDLLAFSPTTYNVITISSDNGSNAEGFTDLTVNVTDAAAISFDWDYTTTDGPLFDSFGILLNGVYTEVSDPNGANTQSGNYALNVAPGDVFGFRSYSADGVFGAATTTVSNFIPGFTGQFDPANWTELLINSDGSATFVEIPGGPLSFDACGITVLAADVTEVTCADIGTPIIITVFASDASGNIAACQSTVTVVDLLAPVITCPEDQTQDPGPGNVLWEVPDFFANGEASATDNCTDPVVITSQDPAAGSLLPDGVYTVTMTAEDEYGNVATCDFELTVESTLGIGDQQELASIILYPNPANNIVRLSNPNAVELESISIYDLTGRLVNKTPLQAMGTEISLDVSRLANATYMVIIKGKQNTITKQLIVNNY